MAFKQRTEKEKTAVYYGTRFDSWMIYSCFTGDNIFHHNNPTGGGSWLDNSLGCTWVYGVVPICFLVDLPISIVTDTIALPYDMYYVAVNESPSKLEVTLPE